MEYYIVRSMMIGMLDKENIEKLHQKENKLGRGLMPSEFTYIFNLPDIKSHYNIPEDIEEQTIHAQRIKKEIELSKCLKTFTGGYVASTDPEILHEYDWNIYHKLEELNLNYKGGKGITGRLKELVKVIPFILWSMKMAN